MRPLILAATSLLLLLLSSPPLMAAEHWILVTTPHFEMYTTNGEKQALAALQVFEQVRYFFLQNSRSKIAPSARVRIVAFRSLKEFTPYRMNDGNFAYYVRSPKADFIVLQDISPEHSQAAIHEYTHLSIEHLDLKIPLWLNEGLAELYSSLEPRGNQALVGRALPESVALLQTQKNLDLNTLFAVDQGSAYYNERSKMSIFYAQSWALTHMLALGREYTPHFAAFQSQLNSGRTAPAALQSVFGKTVPQVAQDLAAYIHQSSMRAFVFDVKLTKADLEPEISEPTDLAVNLTMADLLAARQQTKAQAAAILSELAKTHPESADVQESLGYLALSQSDQDQARLCFKLAMDRGSKNPQMLFTYAQLLFGSAGPDRAVAVLDRVVALQPDMENAWVELGIGEVQARKYNQALGAFDHVKSVKPDQAYRFFSARAFCLLELKAFALARESAEEALKYSPDPLQTANVESLLRQIADSEHPAAAVQPDPPKPITGSVRELVY